MPALLQGETKKRMTDATAQHRSVGKTPLESRRRFEPEAEERAARLFLPRLPQKNERPPRILGPEGEPPALGQAEMRRIAPYLQNGCGRSPARQCRFGDPEGIFQLARQSIQELPRLQPELHETQGIRQACLLSAGPVADP